MANSETVKNALKLFASIWPRDMAPKAQADQVRAYSLALEDLTDEEVTTGAVIAARTERFFPAPAVIREAVRPKTNDSIEATARAARAYDRIVERYEYGHSVGPRWIADAIDDESAHAFMAAGGSTAFSCCEPGRDQEFRRLRFMEAYREAYEDGAAQRLILGANSGKQISHADAVKLLDKIKGDE